MVVPPEFEAEFEQYRIQAADARQQRLHHDQRRELFLTFITRAFHLNPGDISREEFISLIQRHGWIDALFRDLVFEFKRDLDRERTEGLRELQDYLSHLRYGTENIGLLTDGLQFEAYMLADGELRQTDNIDLATVDPEIAFLWLDSYLFSQKGAPPTSTDLVRRFGAHSPTFQMAERNLRRLLARTPGIEVKQQQWRILLTQVYGSDITSDELFIRHTYLAQFAKVLAYTASHGNGAPLHDPDTLARIVDGRAFHDLWFGNVGEADFFAWILEPEVRGETLKILSGLAASLVVYDLSQIDEDLFKQLYQNLVDPAMRHDLGEYYTPDWLAELTLDEVEYRPGQSLLDPSCGSGTFLFSAIRRLAAQGLTGWDLINFVVENVVGVDIHPLAAIITRINYLLALLPHVDTPGGPVRDGKPFSGVLTIPVHNADSLTVTDAISKDEVLMIAVEGEEKFVIPLHAVRDPGRLIEILRSMDSYAHRGFDNSELISGFDMQVAELYPQQKRTRGEYDLTQTYWRNNLRLLKTLIDQRRNSIWIYVLKNRSQPLILALRKFDVLIGNPPWLSYRFIKDKAYQRDVKSLTLEYGLLDPGEVKLFTQMDLSTLFYAFCEDKYLAEGGQIAFVMPRSVLTGAKQHRAFQQRGMTRIIDLKDVEPLFNVETCVVVRQTDSLLSGAIPATVYSGRLPRHEMRLDEAQSYLERRSDTFSALQESAVQSPHYYAHFKQGATLVPRNLVFAKPIRLPHPEATAFNPMLMTDPDMDRDAKAPWKGLKLDGHADPRFWFSTLLSKHLVPFGVRQFNLLVLPLEVDDDGRPRLLTHADVVKAGDKPTDDAWFGPAELNWNRHKKETTPQTLWEWLNYQNKLISQRTRGIVKAVYNTSGTHIAATVVDTRSELPRPYRFPTQGFMTDTTTYSMDFESVDEAHYLCAILNAPCVDETIKRYQPRGLFGERHIHRRPFEICPIPLFDPANRDHLSLARLSREAHAAVAPLYLAEMSVAKAREAARRAAAPQLDQIDSIARRLLGLNG